MSDIIGHSQYFEIWFSCNVSLDKPRYHFDIRFKEDASKIVENEQRLVDLFLADLSISYEDAGHLQAKSLYTPAPARCFQVLKTRSFVVRLFITNPKDKMLNDFIFTLYDHSNNLLETYSSMDGTKQNEKLDTFWNEVDLKR